MNDAERYKEKESQYGKEMCASKANPSSLHHKQGWGLERRDRIICVCLGNVRLKMDVGPEGKGMLRT